MVGRAFVNRFVVALGGFAHVTANLKHQRHGRNHANSREDEADGTPLPGIQVISGQKGEPRPKERTGSGHQHQLGNRQNCSLHDPDSRRPWRLRLFRRAGGRMKVSLVPLGELDAGFLHLLVGQEPDERFVVQVNNLDAVAEWVMEIATEAGDQA